MTLKGERDRFRVPSLPSMLLAFNGFPRTALPEFTGPRLDTSAVHKVQQLRVLEAAGIRVPKWTRLLPDTQINAAEFGENVIIKPTEPGASLGRGITLVKTSNFEGYRDQHASEYESMGRSPPLVQQYIPTGGMPESFRVIETLGQVVLVWRLWLVDNTPLNAPLNTLVLTKKVASNLGERDRELCRNSEVEDFGLLIASAFDSTVQGIDILRSSEDGKLYALEINMGNTWAFSGKLHHNSQTLIGVEAMQNQFNVFDTVGHATIRKAKELLDLV